MIFLRARKNITIIMPISAKMRAQMISKIIQNDSKINKEEMNLEVIFTAVDIFDRYCNLTNKEFARADYRNIAYACTIISSQYYDDMYEFPCKINFLQRNLISNILFTINFKIQPSLHLDELYRTCFNEKQSNFTNAFLNLIIAIFIVDTFNNPYLMRTFSKHKEDKILKIYSNDIFKLEIYIDKIYCTL